MKMMGKNRKKSRISFSPFTNCPCCPGGTPYGRAAEKREWKKQARVGEWYIREA